MTTNQNSPSNQTQNGNIENKETSAAQASETVTNETNSTIMDEKNLNPSEDAQHQSGMTAPESDGTEQTGETAGTTGTKSLLDPVLPPETKKRQEVFTKPITEEAVMEKLKAEGYIGEDGEFTERLLKKLNYLKKLVDRDCPSARLKMLYLASELKKAGYVFCFDKENREINNNHVDDLHERIKADKSGRFSETLKVCEVKQALEQGRKVFDVNNNEITLNTPNLEKHVLILDGQHRWMVILENPKYDIWVDFVETDNIGTYIDNLNNTSKAWNGEDVKHSIRVQHENEVPVLDEIYDFKSRFNVSEKFAELILTRKKEQYRLEDMKKLQSGEKDFNAEKFKVDPVLIETGENLMFAILHQFDAEKRVRKVEFIGSLVNIYDEIPDATKADFEKNILTFLTTMDGIVKAEILKRITAKDTQKLNSYVRKQYDTLLNKHSSELDELYAKAIEIIEKKKEDFETKENNSAKKFKKLKTGSPADILKNRADERTETKKKEEAKAKKGKGNSSKTSNDSKATEKK